MIFRATRLPILFPGTDDLKVGEQVIWELLDRGELHLVRESVPPTSAKQRAAKTAAAAMDFAETKQAAVRIGKSTLLVSYRLTRRQTAKPRRPNPKRRSAEGSGTDVVESKPLISACDRTLS